MGKHGAGVGHSFLVFMLVFGVAAVSAPEGHAEVLLSARGIQAADFWDSQTTDVAPGLEARASNFVMTSVTGPGGWHYEFDPNANAVAGRTALDGAVPAKTAQPAQPVQPAQDPRGAAQRGAIIGTSGAGARVMPFTFALSGSSIGGLRELVVLTMLSGERVEDRTETERYFERRFDRAGQQRDAASSAAQSGPPTISEPASLLLLGTGLIGLARRGWLRSPSRSGASV
jgi:hypothetical protein